MSWAEVLQNKGVKMDVMDQLRKLPINTLERPILAEIQLLGICVSAYPKKKEDITAPSTPSPTASRLASWA
eukprot:scaffold1758_cov333-Pavlova_lutheri.AAC.21